MKFTQHFLKSVIANLKAIRLSPTVRHEHILLQTRIIRHHTVRDAHRSLVHVQKVADAVAGAVRIVEPDVPQCLARQSVQILALNLVWKHSHAEVHLAL